MLRKFVTRDEMIMNGNAKEVEGHQLYEEQGYESGDPIQRVTYNDIKHAQIKELLENGEKNKDFYYSSIL